MAAQQRKKTTPKKSRPRSLVTGACGFMGSHMIEELHAAGHEIVATDLRSAWGEDDRKRGRFPSILKDLGVEFHPSDMRDPASLAPLVEGVDYVFHIASVFSYTAPWEVLYGVNVVGTRTLLDLVVERAPGLKRFVVWGAGGVYGLPSESTGIPFDEEDTPPAPPNDYLRSKWFEEHTVMRYGRTKGVPYAIMRPTTVYGPRCVYGGGQLLMGPAEMKVVMAPRNFTARIPFVHVKDVVGAALHLAITPAAKNGVFNLNDDSQMTNVDYFRFVAEVTGHRFVLLPPIPIDPMKSALTGVAKTIEALRLPIPLEADSLAFLGEDFTYRNDRLKEVGYTFRYADARDGIRDTLAWYRDAGWIRY